MEKETKHTPEFDLPKMKKEVETARKAAEFYIQMHNPHQNLANEPYKQLVIGATNDFLKLEAAGFHIITESELSEMKKEREELVKEVKALIDLKTKIVYGVTLIDANNRQERDAIQTLINRIKK